MNDVAIIGGGVIGLSLAYELAGRGVQVTLMERGELGREASWAGAGILNPGNPKRANDTFSQLRAHGVCLYRTWSERLREETGIDNGYRKCGGLELATDRDGAALLRAAARQWDEEDIRAVKMEHELLTDLEPAIAGAVRLAYYLPDMAQIRNPRHLTALVAACAERGVELRSGVPVSGFEAHRGRVKAVRTIQGPVTAEAFVVASGAWSAALLAEAGVAVTVKPIRGQIVLLETSQLPFRRIIMHGKRYMVPRPDGKILIGSTEEDVGFNKSTTAGAVEELLAFACRLVPELRRAAVERAWAGLRPGNPDGLPYLGVAPGYKNLYVAAGHFRSGLQMAPATAVVLAQTMLGEAPLVPLDDCRLDRAT